MSSNEGRWGVSLVAQLAGLGDRTNDKVTNNQVFEREQIRIQSDGFDDKQCFEIAPKL